MKLPPLRDPDSFPRASSRERMDFTLARNGWHTLLAYLLALPSIAGIVLLHHYAEREIPIPHGWIHAVWLLSLAAAAAWLYARGVVIDVRQGRVIYWHGLRLGMFNLEFNIHAWPLSQIKWVHLYSYTPPGENAVTQHAVDLEIENGPGFRLSAWSGYLSQRCKAERIAKFARVSMCDDTYICAAASIVRRCEELDEPFHLRMKRAGSMKSPKSCPSARFEIRDEGGELQVCVKPTPRTVADWIGWIITFPLVSAIVLFFLSITGWLTGVFAHMAVYLHWGNALPAFFLLMLFFALLVPLGILISEAANFVMPGIRRLRVTRDGLGWTQREYFGERKIPAAEIEELYVSSNGDLVALTDRVHFIIKMGLTDENEGTWLREQIVERFNAATADAAQTR